MHPFLLVIADHDAKTFAVKGPMVDDRAWIDRVVAAQARGRDVRCFTAGAGQSVETVAATYAAQQNYQFVGDIDLPTP